MSYKLKEAPPKLSKVDGKKKDNFSFEFVVYQDEVSENNNDSDGLEIDETPKKNQSGRAKFKMDSNERAVLENIEEEIERQLDEKARLSNISPMNVKHILKHIITNEQVLALVRNSVNNEPFCPDNLGYEPKLTRAKMKELLKNQPSSVSPKRNQSEIHILIDEELPEDEEDDEYIPGEEESEDDRDTLNQSDLESQPSTPRATRSSECGTQTPWIADSLFKVPTTPTQSGKSKAEDVQVLENIALRTRSKLSLSDTPLERIEQAFVPPDITTDMYDIECDDEDWKNFLTEFTQPLENTGVPEDDEETDPEYNILADLDGDAVDKEELRADRGVKVTKRELNDLVAELFDYDELFTPSPCPAPPEENVPKIPEPEPSHPEIKFHIQIMPQVEESTKIVIKPAYNEDVLLNWHQKLLLEQQIQQHIQLASVGFIQSLNHPHFATDAKTYRLMLESIKKKVKINPDTILNGRNLTAALSFVESWEEKFLKNDDDMKAIKDYYQRHITSYFKWIKHRKIKAWMFPKIVMDSICSSAAFIYPSLLPKRAYRPQEEQKSMYIKPELELTAIGLEQFTPMVLEQKLYTDIRGIYKTAAHMIVQYLMPSKDPKYLLNMIKCSRNKEGSPIHYYFKYNVSPPTFHVVLPAEKVPCIPPNKQPEESLVEPWKSYIYPPKKIRDFTVRVPEIKHKYPPNTKIFVPPLKPINLNTKPALAVIQPRKLRKILPKPDKFTPKKPIGPPKHQIFIKFNPQPLLTPNLKKPNSMLPSMPPLQTPIKVDEQVESPKPVMAIIESPPSEVMASSTKPPELPKISKSIKDIEAPEKVIETVVSSEVDTVSESSPETDRVIDKNFSKISEEIKEEEDSSTSTSEEKLDDKKIFTSSEKFKFNKEDDPKDEYSEASTSSKTPIYAYKNKAKTSAYEKKKARQLKETEITVTLLSPKNTKLSEEKAAHYAQAYIHKVHDRLSYDSPEHYNQFLETLSEHDESSSVTDLYSKVTSIFTPKHPDLCDELLTFFTPAQAKLIGKLIPYTKYARMTSFLRMLETFYSKQPAQIRKVYNALMELCSHERPSIETVKSTVVPLLRGNTLLIDYFIQLFPTEKPPESLMTVWEDIDGDIMTGKNPEREEEECFESINLPEEVDTYGNSTCICVCHNSTDEEYTIRNKHCLSCGTKFIQGRVYIQTGKGPRPAHITFAGSSIEEQNKRLSSQYSKRRTEISSPTKNIPCSPNKNSQAESDIDDDISKPSKLHRSLRLNSPKSLPSRRLSIVRSLKSKSELPGVHDPDIVKPSEPPKVDRFDDPTPKKRIRPVSIPFGELETLKKAQSRGNDIMDWDDCNASVESIELRLSPDRSFESCEESSQDLSECNDPADDPGSESENDSIVEADSIHSESSSSDTLEVKEVPWTREEDKILLKTYQQECDSENTFEIIAKLLPNRTVKQIQERFEILINLLVQIRNNDS